MERNTADRHERVAFEKIQVGGFNIAKAESIAVSNNGERIFCGTSEGALNVHECGPGARDATGNSFVVTPKIAIVAARLDILQDTSPNLMLLCVSRSGHV